MLELIAGDLDLDEGVIRSDTEVAYMRQAPGFDDPRAATVLDALALSLPAELRPVHARLQQLYADIAEGSDVGIELAEALEVWQSLGGYGEEAMWDQVTRAVLGQGVDEAGPRLLTQE